MFKGTVSSKMKILFACSLFLCYSIPTHFTLFPLRYTKEKYFNTITTNGELSRFKKDANAP